MSTQLGVTWYRTVYLRSPHWQRLRAQRLKIAGHCCELCGWPKPVPSGEIRPPGRGPLDCHHLCYRNLYDVTSGDLRILCRVCHEARHEMASDFAFTTSGLRSGRAVARQRERRLERKREARRER